MIADKIKSLREARGMTQAELARQLGITRNGVNNWEQGLATPSPASIVQLAKIFKVTADYLLDLENRTTINVEGLSENDIAILTGLASRLQHGEES